MREGVARKKRSLLAQSTTAYNLGTTYMAILIRARRAIVPSG